MENYIKLNFIRLFMTLTKILMLLLVLATLIGCQQLVIDTEEISNASFIEEIQPDVIEVDKGVSPSEADYSIIVTATAGEHIKLNPQAFDPDNDEIEYIFSEPFDEFGNWQTAKNDAGDYLVTIKAFDGVDYTPQDILVRVFSPNMPPVMNCPSKVTVDEGDLIKLNCNIKDPEGDEVVVTYRGFMGTSRYQTTYDDSGEYEVTVTAWNKDNVDDRVQNNVKIVVRNVNRMPIVNFGFGNQITGSEGDLVVVRPTIDDPEDSEVKVRYSEPFDDNGEWKTKTGDAGAYDASVVVSDGPNVLKKEFKVIIAEVNTAPKLKNIPDVHVFEGETVELDVQATDREGDYIYITISSDYMGSDKHTTTYDDAQPNGCEKKGCTVEHTVLVTASDGNLEESQEVTIKVTDRNRPPVFRVLA
uniref:Cadherin domain-containing protein n=1 Tax=uncultured marine group II/III euryarchaeote KM3_83_G03 TaxID=1456522 RepID=A0A075HT66_9EURY|nr:hypothetical protein [uncultured marine group II/III euryarchaeote KM3_83_G03]